MSHISYKGVNVRCFRVQRVAGVTVSTPMEGPEWLQSQGMGQSVNEEQQALLCCPVPVRLAIAAHYQWWFLARSHSPFIRTFSHASMAALSSSNTKALGSAYNLDTDSMELGALTDTGRRACIPYRVLHYLGRYMHESGATGVKANAMDKAGWNQQLRPNSQCYSTMRGDSDELKYGAVGTAKEGHYEEMVEQNGIVRSSHSRMTAFMAAAMPAFQPFLADHFDYTNETLAKLCVPKMVVKKPRSEKTVAMIPRILATSMEVVAEELPPALHWIQHRWCGMWARLVNNEAKGYMQRREEAALVGMAARENLSQWLAKYDRLAAIHYASPTVEAKTVSLNGDGEQFDAGAGIVLSFPGIQNNYA